MSWRVLVFGAWVLWSVWAGHSYAAVWQSNLTLWSHAVQVTPLNPRAHLNYAMALAKAQRFDESQHEAVRSVTLARVQR